MTEEQLETLQALVQPLTKEQEAEIDGIKQEIKVLQAQVYFRQLMLMKVRDSCMSRKLNAEELVPLIKHVAQGLYSALREDSADTISEVVEKEVYSLSVTELLVEAESYDCTD